MNDEIRQMQKAVAFGERVGDLVNSEGWAAFLEHCEESFKGCAVAALAAPDFETVLKSKARAESFQQMSCWLQNVLDASKEARERLSELEQPQLH